MRDYGLEKIVYEALKKADLYVRYEKGSGSLYAGEDIFTKTYLIQCKQTLKTTLRLSIKVIDRLIDNANKREKTPILITSVKDGPLFDTRAYKVELRENQKINVSGKSFLFHSENILISNIYILTPLGRLNNFIILAQKLK